MSNRITLSRGHDAGTYHFFGVSFTLGSRVEAGSYTFDLTPASGEEAAPPAALNQAAARVIVMQSFGWFGDVRYDPAAGQKCCQVGYRASPIAPPVEAVFLTKICGAGAVWEEALQDAARQGYPIIGWAP